MVRSPVMRLNEFYRDTHLAAIHPDCRHFAIYTDHKIIDVLSPYEPQIPLA